MEQFIECPYCGKKVPIEECILRKREADVGGFIDMNIDARKSFEAGNAKIYTTEYICKECDEKHKL